MDRTDIARQVLSPVPELLSYSLDPVNGTMLRGGTRRWAATF
jgi:hypothetical protein